MDYEKLAKAIEYGKSFSPVVFGTDMERLEGYPDQSDNSVLQWVFDTLDPISLDNQWCYEEVQAVLDSWLLEELTPAQARQKLKDIWFDYYDFGC